MIDVVSIGTDIGFFDTETVRAANILSVQVGTLEYAPDLGIDLRYFLSEKFKFQNASFKAYLIEVLATRGINISEVIDTVESLYTTYTFKVNADDQSGGMVAR